MVSRISYRNEIMKSCTNHIIIYIPICFKESNGTIDFIDNRKANTVVFRTCDVEKKVMVFQIGAPEAGIALKAAQVVEKDVGAIDINMGCPKHFSTCGGMGAALLSKPEIAADIIGTLRRNLSIPVFAKIRLLPDESIHNAVELIRRMEKNGVSCVAGKEENIFLSYIIYIYININFIKLFFFFSTYAYFE